MFCMNIFGSFMFSTLNSFLPRIFIYILLVVFNRDYCMQWKSLKRDLFPAATTELIMSMWLDLFLLNHTAIYLVRNHYTSFKLWSWCIHVSQACVTWPWPHFHSLPTLLNSHPVFVISSVVLLLYNLYSPYLIYTLKMQGIYIYHLTLTSFSLSMHQCRVHVDVQAYVTLS